MIIWFHLFENGFKTVSDLWPKALSWEDLGEQGQDAPWVLVLPRQSLNHQGELRLEQMVMVHTRMWPMFWVIGIVFITLSQILKEMVCSGLANCKCSPTMFYFSSRKSVLDHVSVSEFLGVQLVPKFDRHLCRAHATLSHGPAQEVLLPELNEVTPLCTCLVHHQLFGEKITRNKTMTYQNQTGRRLSHL